MSSVLTAILIILGLVGLFLLYKWLKPYVIKHDTTILFTGGLGSGKTLESVKLAIVLLRKNIFIKYTLVNGWRKFVKPFKNHHNKWVMKHPTTKKGKIRELWKIKALNRKPKLYSNIPISYKPHFWSSKRVWATMLTESHILLLDQIREYSVVLIDEFPQFVNQFMWDEQLVQDNLNEFITFYRHYIGGYFIVNAQSESEIECHVRRKLNQAIYCYDFKKWFFGLFYTNRMLDIMLSEDIQTMTTAQAEENTKIHFGLFPPRKTYDTRCYSVRYQNIYKKGEKNAKWEQLKTMKVLRLKEYISPLDLETTKEQKEKQYKQVQKLMRKEVKKDEKD